MEGASSAPGHEPWEAEAFWDLRAFPARAAWLLCSYKNLPQTLSEGFAGECFALLIFTRFLKIRLQQRDLCRLGQKPCGDLTLTLIRGHWTRMYPTEVVAVVQEAGPLWERLLSSMTQLSPGQQLPRLTLHFLKWSR